MQAKKATTQQKSNGQRAMDKHTEAQCSKEEKTNQEDSFTDHEKHTVSDRLRDAEGPAVLAFTWQRRCNTSLQHDISMQSCSGKRNQGVVS